MIYPFDSIHAVLMNVHCYPVKLKICIKGKERSLNLDINFIFLLLA